MESQREEVVVAYYADLLSRRGSQGPDDLESLDEFERELVGLWLESCGLPEATAAGRSTAPLRQALAWLARSRGLGRPAVEWFVAVCFREVAAYLRDPVREQVRSRVAEALAKQRPTVVIAHSLGSVVAYETLWAHPELQVDLLVTLGSPLALPHAVFPRLQPAPVEKKGRRPPNVTRWVNIADPGDLVAIPPGGVRDGFLGVQELEGQPIHAFDFHKAVNYLATPQLRDVLDAQGT
ncbi:serine peptidase [Streptomyces sp. NPDC057621]|uniref:serine peptidase n=1 Tax=Streptomyces sp. NPDC057621 TaxID=3346186 RepID=UPI0036B62099